MSKKLSNTDIGRKVIYKSHHCDVEEGVITSFNDSFVFVKYGTGSTSQATRREDLNWL